MKKLQAYIAFCFLLAAAFGFAAGAGAAVPVKVSIKFILDANGNRPTTGLLHSDDQINDELDWATRILQRNLTEFQLGVVEFIDLAGVSQHYTDNIKNDTQFAGLRNDAIADPATYHWRTDALNIYINAGGGSARSVFPPDNDYILFNQGCGNTPSCILHEMGHSLNLMHTHEGGGTDSCADTLPDNESWTKDQLSQNSFGKIYSNLTAAQQDQVNLTYNNIMSYHLDEPQLRISPCQMGRVSAQGYTVESQLYSPVGARFIPHFFLC